MKSFVTLEADNKRLQRENRDLQDTKHRLLRANMQAEQRIMNLEEKLKVLEAENSALKSAVSRKPSRRPKKTEDATE